MMNPIRTALAGLALLCLAPSCTTLTPAPIDLTEQTKLDEQAALAVTLAYTAAARAAAVGIEAGLIKDGATIARIGALDRAAFAAVQGVERAYRAGNAASYAAALSEARAAISLFLSSVKG